MRVAPGVFPFSSGEEALEIAHAVLGASTKAPAPSTTFWRAVSLICSKVVVR